MRSSTTSEKAAPQAYDAQVGLRQYNDGRAVYMVAAQSYKVFAWGSLAVAVLALSIALVQARAPREVPYIVAMNSDNAPSALGIAPMLSQDQRAEVLITQYVLRQFVQNWRSVVAAPDFQTKMIRDYVTPFVAPGSQASSVISNFYQAANPYARAKNYYVEVSVDEPVPQTPTTYDLHWTETVKTATDVTLQTSEWRGFATISYVTPTMASIRLNPAGIAITNLTLEQTSVTNATPHP